TDSFMDVKRYLRTTAVAAERVTPHDPASRWIVGTRDCVVSARALRGASAYVGRAGVFTGGANAVYYLHRKDSTDAEPLPWFTNETARAKRNAPSVRVRIEAALVYEVVRGRDLTRWAFKTGALMLLPHTKETRMRAIAPAEMRAAFPHAWTYLNKMRDI